MIRHFTASGIVLSQAEQVLLVEHRKLGMWLYPGGHIEPDEDPVQAPDQVGPGWRLTARRGRLAVMTEHTHHHDEDSACAVAHSPVLPASSSAGTAGSGAGAERTLVAVFASPVAGYLLRYAADMGFRGLLLEPDEARAAGAAALGFPLLTEVPDDLDDSADLVVTDHHRPELGVMLRDALVTKARWVGIMGNPHHVGPHVQMLTDLGVPPAEIARVHRPVGLNIGSRTPPEIAVATLAGLLADRNGRPGGFHF